MNGRCYTVSLNLITHRHSVAHFPTLKILYLRKFTNMRKCLWPTFINNRLSNRILYPNYFPLPHNGQMGLGLFWDLSWINQWILCWACALGPVSFSEYNHTHMPTQAVPCSLMLTSNERIQRAGEQQKGPMAFIMLQEVNKKLDLLDSQLCWLNHI